MATIVGTTVMPQQQVVTHMPATVVTVPQGPHPATKNKNIFMGLGITQLVIGVLCVILGGVGVSPTISGGYAYIGSGIWGGFWFIAAGALGMATGFRPCSCNVIAGMIVTILAAITAFSVGIIEGVAAGAGAWICNSYSYYPYDCNAGAFVGIHGFLAFLCFVEFIVTITHSAYCCSGCCGSSNNTGAVMATTTTYQTQPMPMQQAYPQPQYYPPQPQAVQGQQPMYTNYAQPMQQPNMQQPNMQQQNMPPPNMPPPNYSAQEKSGF